MLTSCSRGCRRNRSGHTHSQASRTALIDCCETSDVPSQGRAPVSGGRSRIYGRRCSSTVNGLAEGCLARRLALMHLHAMQEYTVSGMCCAPRCGSCVRTENKPRRRVIGHSIPLWLRKIRRTVYQINNVLKCFQDTQKRLVFSDAVFRRRPLLTSPAKRSHGSVCYPISEKVY